MFRRAVSYPAFVQIMEEHAGSDYSERRIANVSWVTSQSCRRIGDHVSETEAEQTAVPLDDVDRDIIRELTTDGRMSITQVAENVHISRAHAYSRIARLTGEGVLTKFTALVDPIKAG